MLKDFRKFLMRGNVIDLAVAVVIGAAFKPIIDAVVDMITNILAIPGDKGHDFSSLHFTIGGGNFKYGVLIQAIISFIIVAAAIFFIVVTPMNKLAERRKAGAPADEDTPAPSDEAVLLAEIRDLLRSRP